MLTEQPAGGSRLFALDWRPRLLELAARTLLAGIAVVGTAVVEQIVVYRRRLVAGILVVVVDRPVAVDK